MTLYWLRLLCLFGLGGSTLTSQAQGTASYSRPQASIPDPVYVLNSTVIINGLPAKLKPQEIKKVVVYKPGAPDTQAAAPHLNNLGVGVLDITSAKRVRSQSFSQLGRQLGLKGPLTFALNGHSLDPPAVAALRITPAAIGQIHILRPTTEQPETRVDIWLVPSPKPDTSQYPPETIFVR